MLSVCNGISAAIQRKRKRGRGKPKQASCISEDLEDAEPQTSALYTVVQPGQVSVFERARLQRMKDNDAMMLSLGIPDALRALRGAMRTVVQPGQVIEDARKECSIEPELTSHLERCERTEHEVLTLRSELYYYHYN